MTDTARALLADPRAPADERYDANLELQKANVTGGLSAALMPNKDVAEIVNYIRNDLEEQDFMKSISSSRVVQFPAKNAGRPGMQSVYLDDMQISWQGAYFDKPGTMNFQTLRAMADGTPLIASIIMTRVRQVMRFCSPQESGEGPGFTVRHIDKDHAITDAEKDSVQLLTKFFQNCGWEWNPRERRRRKRDDLPSFMAKSVRDSLILDNAPIETEMKRNKGLGIDGFYAVDGATVHLVNELDHEGEDEIFACQVVNGQVRAAYGYDDLILLPRNPRSDILVGGYGMSELELLVKIVTGFLNALQVNLDGFSKNSIPRGFMTLVGNYGEQDLAAFKRYWSAQVKGVQNHWNVPLLLAKDGESKAEFHEIGGQFDEVMYSKWMELLGAIACAVYSIAPEEINWSSFTSSKSSLSGSDTTEKMAQSMDKGLRPLLTYYQNLFSDYIVSSFSDKYLFRWTGLDEEDEEKRHEVRKLVLTVDELRAQEGYDAHPDPMLGNAPVNPTLSGIYMQGLQAQQQPEDEDFGQPNEGGNEQEGEQEPGEQGDGTGGGNSGEPVGPDEGDQGDATVVEAPAGEDGSAPGRGEMKKSEGDGYAVFGLPPMRIGVDW
jgi:hypothetical protein